MKTYVIFISFFIGIIGIHAQTTAIPDPKFEQVLIDLGIDSDGTINGQVLTADIANVTVLDIPNNREVDNLIGIEDFSSLKVLDISDAGFAGFPGIPGNPNPNPYILNLSEVHSLEELYMNSALDHGTVTVNYIDLSDNPNLKKIEIRDNWTIQRVNLKGSDLSIGNLDIDLSGSSDVCIQVTNVTDAQNGQGVYATWNVCCSNFVFSEDCNNLDTESFVKNNLQLYPNPATELFRASSQENIKTLSIYDMQGKLVKRYAQSRESYPVADMVSGLYLLEIQTLGGQKQFLKLAVE